VDGMNNIKFNDYVMQFCTEVINLWLPLLLQFFVAICPSYAFVS
jgi:hypothetical protein